VVKLQLYCSFTAALLLVVDLAVELPGGGGALSLSLFTTLLLALLLVVDLTVELPGGGGVVKALLLLYCCFTAAILLVDFRSRAARRWKSGQSFTAALLLLYCCFTAAIR
jgi:hypothetical protein